MSVEYYLDGRAPLYTDVASISTTATAPIRIHRLGSRGKQKLVFVSSVDCYVRFGLITTGVATNAYELFKANTPTQLDIVNDSTHFSVLGTGSGTFTWYIENSVGLDPVQELFGSLFVDSWIRESGASSLSWRSVNGRSLAKSGSPAFAQDSTFFNADSVVKCDDATSSYYSATGLASLAANGTRPYIAVVGRARALGVTTFLDISDGTTSQFWFLTLGGNFVVQYKTGVSQLFPLAADTNVHLFEFWLDGVNLNFAIDGAVASTAQAGTIGVALTGVCVGMDFALASAGGVAATISRVIVCSSVPGNREALLPLVRKLDGF